MLAQIDEERGEVAAQDGGSIVDGEDSIRQPYVSVVFAAVGEGAEGIAEHTVDPFSASIGVLVVR